jgi:hypothetical protein
VAVRQANPHPHASSLNRTKAMPSFFSRFFSSDVNTFAAELVEDLSKRLPPVLMNDEKRRPSAKRIGRILETSLARAVDYKRTKRLGVYGKAKLANEFRWQLKEKGYNDAFIDLATEAITVYVSRRDTPPNSPSSGRA